MAAASALLFCREQPFPIRCGGIHRQLSPAQRRDAIFPFGLPVGGSGLGLGLGDWPNTVAVLDLPGAGLGLNAGCSLGFRTGLIVVGIVGSVDYWGFLTASTTQALRGKGLEGGVDWVLQFITLAWPTQFGQELPQDLSSSFIHGPGRIRSRVLKLPASPCEPLAPRPPSLPKVRVASHSIK